jgi:hypothetical protein
MAGLFQEFFTLFNPEKYIFSCYMWNSRSMDILHDHTDFGLWRPIFSFLISKVYFFMFHVKFLIDISHDHTDFGPQIPFLGSRGLFLAFCPQMYRNNFFLIRLCHHFIKWFHYLLLISTKYLDFFCKKLSILNCLAILNFWKTFFLNRRIINQI